MRRAHPPHPSCYFYHNSLSTRHHSRYLASLSLYTDSVAAPWRRQLIYFCVALITRLAKPDFSLPCMFHKKKEISLTHTVAGMFSSAFVVVRGDEKTTLCLWYPFFVVIVREFLLWCDVRHDVSVLVKEKTFLSLSLTLVLTHSIENFFFLFFLFVCRRRRKSSSLFDGNFEVFDDGWPTFDCLLNLLTLMGFFREFFTQNLMTAVQFAFFDCAKLGIIPMGWICTE